MERIIYRLTLDTHKNGIQRTLQGFETADNMGRRIAVNLTSCGDTYEIPYGVIALMYVKPSETDAVSITECTIDGNTIIYDALQFNTEGIFDMQIKLIEMSVDGAKKVIASPKFAVEVSQSNIDDEGAEQTQTFTALEGALAKAEGVYNSRLERIEITSDYNFRAYYADGTIYENSAIKDALASGYSALAKSWAIGGTGERDGEDTNNAMYFSNMARSSSLSASQYAKTANDLLDEMKKHSIHTVYKVNFETGHLTYESYNYRFHIDVETGQLVVKNIEE